MCLNQTKAIAIIFIDTSMAPAISNDLKERIIHLYYTNQMTMEQIRDILNCSLGLIYNTICNFRDFGQVTNPFARKTGRPPSLSNEDLLFLTTLLDANPSLYLDELQQKLHDIRDINTSLATISRALHSINLSRKAISTAAAERDQELWAIWEGMMAEYTDPDVFVALDESAVDNKIGQRDHGWSPVGMQCVRRMSFLRGVRYSILPALSTDGIIALEIIEGSVTKDKFLKFLREQVVCNLFVLIP